MRKFISRIILFLLVIFLFIIPVCIHYNDFSYPFDFYDTIGYEDIFFETDSCEYSIYGIGSYDIYTDRLIEKELDEITGDVPHSDAREYGEKKGIEEYSEFLIERRNKILSKCSFKKVDSKKSFGLSFLFN